MNLHGPEVDVILRRALEEDLGADGDRTTEALVPEGLEARGIVVAEEPVVVAGASIAFRVFTLLDEAVRCTSSHGDGELVPAGTALLELVGSARALLTGERTALNVLGLLCGVATRTRRAVEEVRGTSSRIYDTRKTTPGLRILEKFAVRCGGGENHRMGLFDMALIKENHIALAGGVRAAIRAARVGLPPEIQIQVEVRDLTELDAAVEAGAEYILFDHAPPDALAEAVRRTEGHAVLEASGGISLEGVRDLARATDVPRISMGTLTRGAVWSDLSMDVEPLDDLA
jgi:nicotinate-nucleotide pyrophosphorylase (carboxylating)